MGNNLVNSKVMKDIGVKSFCDFCKNNIPLLTVVAAVLFFCYQIKLFQYSIGIDTEFFMSDQTYTLFEIGIGRFGLVFLQSLLNTVGYNPFMSFLTTFCIIWFFAISWCYIIAVFRKNTGRNNAFIPFALVFVSSPILAEQFYFGLQSREIALMILLCPYTIYFLFKGFLDNEKNKVIFAFCLLFFMISVYQAMVPFFCCGVFVCFMLLLEHSDYKPSICRSLCVKILATLVLAMGIYFVIDRVLIPAVFHIEKDLYLYDMNQWGQRSVKENILFILLFAYTMTIGTIPQVQDIMNPILAQYANSGMKAVNVTVNTSKVFGSSLLMPIILFFYYQVINIARKKIPSNLKFLYVLAGICISLSFMFLAFIGGDKPPIRTIYVLPFAFAFMFLFLIENYPKRIAIFIAGLALLLTASQTQITSQLLYSDQMRYNEDVRLAYEIQDAVAKIQSDNENLPIAIMGTYKVTKKFKTNYLKGQIMGSSFFDGNIGETIDIVKEVTERGLNFMQTLGINFNMPSSKLFEQAIVESASMPSYPNEGYVKKFPDVIVVKLSDFN